MSDFPSEVLERARRVRALLLDVDGVLTDGRIYVSQEGTVTKRFDIRDGHILVLMRRLLDFPIALISGRNDGATDRRADDLLILWVFQGVKEKISWAHNVAERVGCTLDEMAYMGDDINDVPLLREVGLSTVPANASKEATDAAHWVSDHPGGQGAVRQLAELILKSQGTWDTLLDSMG